MSNSASADRRQGDGHHRYKALLGTGIVSRVGREAQGTWPFAACRPSWGECSSAYRVAGGGCPPPALTEPDLWASHPALRDVGVGGTQST